MARLSNIRLPPRRINYANMSRRVGVELEFAAVSAQQAANTVVELYGGKIEREDAHRYRVSNTRFGVFAVELDTQYAHRESDTTDQPERTTGFAGWFDEFSDTVREFYGDVGSLVIPYEVVCPPIAIEELPELEKLVDALRAAGAKGTRDHLLHAFGAQYNPDIATKDPDWILSILKAEILISDWLRAIMSIDTARQVLAFAEPFPAAYARKVVRPTYWPDMETIIDDYLVSNKTRNRELDMLPLFAWLDRNRVNKAISDKLVRPRPTFHYRLPDANIGQPDWSLTLEWNRWCVVERLAEDRERLDLMGAAYIENSARFLPKDWSLLCTEWLVID